MVLVFDRRYGPCIPGYQEKSATRIEYETAKAAGIPIIAFARSEFLIEHRAWSRARRSGMESQQLADVLSYVSSKRDAGVFEFDRLFAFFDEVRRASVDGRNVWFDPFSDAVGLCRIAVKRLKEILRNDVLELKRTITAAFPEGGNPGIQLTVPTLRRALEMIVPLQLPERISNGVMLAALEHRLPIDAAMANLRPADRTKLLQNAFSLFVENRENHPCLIRYFQSDLISAVSSYLSGEQVRKRCAELLSILGPKREFYAHLRNHVHGMLLMVLQVPWMCDVMDEMRTVEAKKILLKILGEFGSIEDAPLSLLALGDRGILGCYGDPEHQQMSEPTCYGFDDRGLVVKEATQCFSAWYNRGDRRVDNFLIAAAISADVRESTRTAARKAWSQICRPARGRRVEKLRFRASSSSSARGKTLEERESEGRRGDFRWARGYLREKGIHVCQADGCLCKQLDEEPPQSGSGQL